MLDMKVIRENPDAFDEAMKKRGQDPFAKELLEQDEERRIALTELQEFAALINAGSKKAGELKAMGDEKGFETLRDATKEHKIKLAKAEEKARKLEANWINFLANIPNIPMDDVPDGKDEEDNKEFHRWGNFPNFAFTPKEHHEIPSVQPGMDFETAGKISGSRFVMLSGPIARLHRALAQFMLDLHILEHDLTEINTPVIVNTRAMRGTGQLPKFIDDCYMLHRDNTDKENTTDHWLIPTSEVPLTNIVAGEILNKYQLPLRYTAHSLCFRQEAGAAGRDTAGMLRQHQFEKVEMVSITTPEESRAELDRMTKCAEAVLERLELAYRTVVLCTGDMGFSAQRTHDIEVWLPGQNKYREISSCSVCGDFQARRMNARYRPAEGEKPRFVHTLNGSGVAVGRCLIAVLENGQQADGSVVLPKALHPYLGGKTKITPDGVLA